MPAVLYMDARLTPTRSLSRRGFAWLIGVLIAVNLVMACVFVFALRAFPIPVFLGLDVLGVWIAFRINYGRAGQAERVQVSASEVRVSHEMGRIARTVWTSPTAFTRVDVEAPGEHETRVRLRLSGRSLTIGHALSPGERADLAEALQTAIRAARAERW